jgi:hypothetical protein
MRHYETTAGYVTRQENFAKILELMRELESCFYVAAHLHLTETGHRDANIATGFRAMGQLMSRARDQVLALGQGRLS